MVRSERPNRLRQIAIAVTVVLGLLVLAALLFPRSEISDNMYRAQLGCTGLSTAIDAYANHEANTKHELPLALSDLPRPPFGGSSFLRNGASDLRDPWGKPYQMELKQFSDGQEYILVYTTARDGTPISQFGIGRKNAFPKQ